jgi:hypothetical protein
MSFFYNKPKTMLKFFRNLRQKTGMQGNFKKYMLYALGEILLVVLGILIVLLKMYLPCDKKQYKVAGQ